MYSNTSFITHQKKKKVLYQFQLLNAILKTWLRTPTYKNYRVKKNVVNSFQITPAVWDKNVTWRRSEYFLELYRVLISNMRPFNFPNRVLVSWRTSNGTFLILFWYDVLQSLRLQTCTFINYEFQYQNVKNMNSLRIIQQMIQNPASERHIKTKSMLQGKLVAL